MNIVTRARVAQAEGTFVTSGATNVASGSADPPNLPESRKYLTTLHPFK
jgi:hypothetical protein